MIENWKQLWPNIDLWLSFIFIILPSLVLRPPRPSLLNDCYCFTIGYWSLHFPKIPLVDHSIIGNTLWLCRLILYRGLADICHVFSLIVLCLSCYIPRACGEHENKSGESLSSCVTRSSADVRNEDSDKNNTSQCNLCEPSTAALHGSQWFSVVCNIIKEDAYIHLKVVFQMY